MPTKKKSRATKKTGHTTRTKPIFYLTLNEEQADALYRAVREQKRCIGSRLADMVKDDGHSPDDCDGYTFEFDVYNDLDREVGGVVGYFENGYFAAPDLRQKLPITE